MDWHAAVAREVLAAGLGATLRDVPCIVADYLDSVCQAKERPHDAHPDALTRCAFCGARQICHTCRQNTTPFVFVEGTGPIYSVFASVARQCACCADQACHACSWDWVPSTAVDRCTGAPWLCHLCQSEGHYKHGVLCEDAMLRWERRQVKH
jgi:hypothetical protein